MRTEEEARAAAFRAKLQRHERLRLSRENALAGSPAELADLEEGWAPLLRDVGWEPVVHVRESGEAAGGVTAN